MFRKVGHKAAMSEGDATVTSFRVVVRDGWYNAFTDLALWKNYWWLAYRRGTGHGAALSVQSKNEWGGLKAGTVSGGNSFSVILRSTDLRRWHEAKVFEPPGGIADGAGIDLSTFCATDDRLYAFMPVKWPGVGRMHCSWTEDGVTWTEPEELRMGDTSPYTWRVRYRDGRFYSAINAINFPGPEQPLDLIASDDGTNWTAHARIAAKHPKLFTEESDLHWLPDGELWCVVRSGNGALFYWAKPPYTEWSGTDLGVRCDAPVMCTANGKVYLAGRVEAPGEEAGSATGTGGSGTTGLYHLTRGKAKLLLSLPPGGDAAYAGLVSPEPGKLVMSTYSDQAYFSDAVKPRHFPKYLYKRSDCDIYVAEIELRD